RRGEDVVGGLGGVDVVIGVHRGGLGAGQGGDDLVGVHVRGGARAGLEHVDREVVIELARDHAFGGGLDGFGALCIEDVQLAVRLRGGVLDLSQGGDVVAGEHAVGDLEVLHRT